MKKRPLLSQALYEVGLWYSLPTVFLSFYLFTYPNPSESALIHLYLISLIFIAVIALRGLLSQIPSNKNLSSIIASFVYATTLFSMIVYYALVIIGLKSWGRVITEELIVSYSNQAKELCDALGLPYRLILCVLIIVFLTIWIGSYYYITRSNKLFNNQSKITKKISPPILGGIFFTLIIVSLNFIDNYTYSPNKIKYSEPISLTLWAGKPSSPIHDAIQGSHVSDESNELERKTIANYKKSSSIHKNNLILIVVDALRPRNMSVYGYPRKTTPNLDSLEQQGLLQITQDVRSSCSESACGLISLASSRYIYELPDKPLTLLQVLRLYGYKVHLILSGDHTNFYNLKKQYGAVDSYFDASMSKDYVNNDEIILEKVKSLPNWDEKPTMFQFHLMSTHPMGKRLEKYKIFTPEKNYTPLATGRVAQKYTNFYDNGVLQSDAIINEILEQLKLKHYLNDALIVITADHGEALGEHNVFCHANNVWEESLNIPLLFISYGENTKQIPQLRKVVSQVDIAPTILYQFGINIPENWSGTPIQLATEPSFTHFQLFPDEGIYDHRQPNQLWKYWFNFHTGREFAFNLSLDPQENNNLVSKVPSELKQDWRNQLSHMKH